MKATDYYFRESFYKRWVLSPLGLDYDNSIVLWMLLFFASVTYLTFNQFSGNVAVVLLTLYLSGVLILSFLRPDFSFYVLIAGTMLFEQYSIPNFPTFTHQVGFFSNLKEIPYLPFFDAGVVSPMELHLIFLLSALLIMASISQGFRFKSIPVSGPFLLFFLSLILSLVYGLVSGGDFLISLWEVRALFYLCILYLLVPQLLSTRRHINILMWIILIGATIKAGQGIQRFVTLGFTTGGYDVLTNHEDPVFIVALFILFMGFLAYRVNDKQKVWLLSLLPILMLGFYVAQRRAVYASLIVSIVFFVILLPAMMRISFMKYFVPAAFVLIVYGFAFWNSESTLGRPVQMVKSGIEKPDKYTNTRDYYSNLYRDYENYNLASTVTNNTITGIGFGKRYEQPIPLVEIRFPLRDYIPHNQIIWILVKMGAIGFFAFWFFFNSFVAKGTRLIYQLKDPYLKAVATMIVLAVINQMVVSFFDLQLTYYRNMIFLGSLMGLLSVIEHIHSEDSKNQIAGE